MTPFVAFTGTLPEFPWIYWAPRQEVVEPYRRCGSSLVVRFSRRRGVTFGLWRRTGFDEDRALSAVGVRGHGRLRNGRVPEEAE